MARWAKVAWSVVILCGVFMAGLYVGRAGRSTRSAADMLPSSLAGIPTEEVEEQVRADFTRLKRVYASLLDLSVKATALKVELLKRREAEGRKYFLPEEDDRIRWHFVTFLSQRSALLRLVATYADFQSVREPETRARCFMVGYAAGVIVYEAGLSFLARFGDDAAVRRKLNEQEPAWGIDPGTYDRVYQSVASKHNLQMCEEMAAYYEHHRVGWSETSIWAPEEFAWMDVRIREGLGYVRGHSISRPERWFEQLLARMKDDAYRPVYKAQSILSCWIGDTRIVQTPPLITHYQIEETIASRLKPGDILLERRNWYLSNAFLPGFWPHAALYVGTIDDLKKLGVAEHPEVRSRLSEYLKPAQDGGPVTVIESVSEGVIFNSLTHSMHADHVAVLRPRLPDERIAEAIVRAFTHQGKPYDYEFDFFSSDKLVCTELVYRAYEGMLHFDLVPVMGRDTLPAIEIVRKFDRERSKPNPEMDFVLFLDGIRPLGRADLADEEAFCSSADRNRAFNE